MVKPKKFLGQHFLIQPHIAQDIAQLVPQSFAGKVLEVGPGTGVLTQFLFKKWKTQCIAIEIDPESIAYLHEHFAEYSNQIVEGDFLKLDLNSLIQSKQAHEPWFVMGNFPYHISSQIMFAILEQMPRVEGFAGMFQREVAQRIAAKPGSKEYGILSVLMQAYYTITYHFSVEPDAFNPPPKVWSGVISGYKHKQPPQCDFALLKEVVKTAFNQRRKMLPNALKKFNINSTQWEQMGFSKLRPENLTYQDFELICNTIQP